MQFSFSFPGGSGTTILTTSVSVAASAWSNKTATASVSGVTTTSNIILGYDETTWDAAKAAVIRASAVAANSVTFKCENTPSTTVVLNLAIF